MHHRRNQHARHRYSRTIACALGVNESITQASYCGSSDARPLRVRCRAGSQRMRWWDDLILPRCPVTHELPIHWRPIDHLPCEQFPVNHLAMRQHSVYPFPTPVHLPITSEYSILPPPSPRRLRSAQWFRECGRAFFILAAALLPAKSAYRPQSALTSAATQTQTVQSTNNPQMHPNRAAKALCSPESSTTTRTNANAIVERKVTKFWASCAPPLRGGTRFLSSGVHCCPL